MKVLMVTPFFHPIVIGGSETQIKNICLRLIEDGKITADVITFNRSKTFNPLPYGEIKYIDGIKVIRVPGFNFIPRQLHHPKINFMVNIFPYNFKQKFNDYDILHFHNETDLSFPVFSYNVRKPKIFHLRCLSVTYPIFKQNLICRLILKKIANIYIVQSKYVERLLKNLGIPTNRIEIVHSGVDISRFRPGKIERDENLILFVGRIEENKGLHIILKSLEFINSPIRLVIVGPLVGKLLYHKKIFKLIEKIKKQNFHKVVYVGPKKQEEIIKLYQIATAVIVPSLAESFSNVILEALACETPVIASNVGGTPEIITNYKNGILIPANEYRKLAEAVNILLSDKHLSRKLGQEGRKKVMERFSVEATVRKLIRIYTELLAA